MIKKILMVGLWTVALTFGAFFIAVLLCIAYLRLKLHGATPSEHDRQFFGNISICASQIAPPIALLLGVFGLLPGTRLRANSPCPSEWARWCYRVCAAVAMFAMLVSIFWDGSVWDFISITPMGFALGAALIDKYTQKLHSTGY